MGWIFPGYRLTLKILRNDNNSKGVSVTVIGSKVRGLDRWERVASIEGDRGRRTLGTQVIQRPVCLPGSQTRGPIVLFSRDKARVRGPPIFSSREILARGDPQYRGVASAVNYIPDSVVRVPMLVMPTGKLVT